MIASAFTKAILILLAATDAPVDGRTEVTLRGADVVFSRGEGFETVLRVPFSEGLAGLRVDGARIEIDIAVDGEVPSFTPFVIIATAAEPDPERPGEFRAVGNSVARELIFAPTLGCVVRLSATGVARVWAATSEDSYLRILVDEPIESNREPGFVRFSSSDVLGRIVVLTRPPRTETR